MSFKKLVSKVGLEQAVKMVKEVIKPKNMTINYELKADIGKSGFFKPNYYFPAVLSTVDVDEQGQSFSSNFLEKVPQYYKEIKGWYGNEHPEGFERDEEPAFFFRDIKYQEGRVLGNVWLNKKHPNFDTILKSMQAASNRRGLSVEVKNATLGNDFKTIYGGDIVGFIVTDNPANKNATFI